MTPRRILLLCVHNSARSQLAEGLLRGIGGDRFAAFSAGTAATHVRPPAIRATGELGTDLVGQIESSRQASRRHAIARCAANHAGGEARRFDEVLSHAPSLYSGHEC